MKKNKKKNLKIKNLEKKTNQIEKIPKMNVKKFQF